MLMLKPVSIDRSAADARISAITFIAHVGFAIQGLAHTSDSLVRVSRRVEWNHFVIASFQEGAIWYQWERRARTTVVKEDSAT